MRSEKEIRESLALLKRLGELGWQTKRTQDFLEWVLEDSKK